MYFVKPFSGDFEVAHLYEHIEANRIESALLAKGFIPFIDFSVDAETYFAGHMFLRLRYANEKVRQTAEQLLASPATPQQNEIDNSLFQLACEEHKSYKVTGNIPSLLQKLADVPWRSEDETSTMLADDAAGNLENPVQSGLITFHEDIGAFSHFQAKYQLPSKSYAQHPSRIALFDILTHAFQQGFMCHLRNQKIGAYSGDHIFDRTSQYISHAAPLTLSSVHITETELQRMCLEYKKYWLELIKTRSHNWKTMISQDAAFYHRMFDGLYNDYGLVISRPELSSVMTPEAAQAILAKVECQFAIAVVKNFDFSLK